MRLLTTILIVFFYCSCAQAGELYFRPDGGNSTQCDGTVDASLAEAVKSGTKKCSLNWFSKEMKSTKTNPENLWLGTFTGTMKVTIGLPDLWVTLATFNKNPDFHIKAVKSGRKVFISDLDGIAYELILRKY